MITPSDVKQITMSLLEDKAFLTALAHNNTFASALSQNDEFVNSVLKNPKFTKGINGLAKEEITVSYGSPEFVQALEYGVLNTDIFCEVPTRLRNVEYETGLVFHDDDDEYEPTIHERVQDLEYKIINYNPGLTVSPCVDIVPETKTEIRASLLVDALKASKKTYFSTPDIMDFLKCKLPDSCKIDENVKNLRKVKQDVVSKAVKMFASIVEPNRKTTGHKDIRLVLKS